jgi:hypothetical protein
MHHRKLLRSLLIGAVLFAGGVAFADDATTQALLDLLVKKGLITQQDAVDLQNQAKANAAAAAAPAAAAPTTFAGGGGVPPTTNVSGSPLAFRIGAANFTPVGFMDFTGVFRSTTVGSGIGTSFGSIPYSNVASTTIGPLSETRFSAQNSRLGLRVDSNIGDAKVLGYVETDFLGNSANNISTVSNSDTLRLRVYFADAKLSSGWEFLAGQDWSLLTPNRKGLSPMPSDIFYTMNMDTNYQVGLVWSRQPQIRAMYHASDALTLGLSLENPDQYVGSAVTLPTTNFNANQVDISAGSNSSGTTTPNILPDAIGKIAYDTKLGDDMPFHAEVAGVAREFKINTFASNGTINANSSATGYGGSLNLTLGLAPNLTLIGTSLVGEGIGRYISTGLGPDFVVSPADAAGVYHISLEHAYAGIAGFEWAACPVDTLFGYYGLAHYGQDFFQTGPTSFLGYGYAGSANSNNKSIEEYTLGNYYTIWKNPQYGALQLILQASYLDRKPWFVATGAPSDAHVGMFFFDVRYTLP